MASETPSRRFQEHLLPIFQVIVDLGSSLLRWRKVWTDDIDTRAGTITRTPTATTDIVNKAYADTLSGSPTVEEVDGSPSVTGSSTIRFDQADGFVVSTPGAAIARVDLAAIPTSALAGPITTAKGGTNIDTSASTGAVIVDAGVWSVPATLTVAKGGTALASGTSGGVLGYTAAGTLASSAALTLRGLVIGGGAGATPTSIAALTNGQLAIGSTGANPVPATLTQGANITITNAAGSITIAAAATGQTVFHFTPVAAIFPTTNFPQLVKNSDTNWTAYTLDYDQTTSESAFWYAAIPTAAAAFTGATVEIFYRTSVTTGTVTWATTTITRADGEAWDTAGTTDTSAADTVPGTAQQVGYVSTALTTTGWAAGEVLLVKIARDISDTAAADVKLIHALIRLT